jgi:hypothetical protein
MGAERDAGFDPVLWLKHGESVDYIAGQMSAHGNLSFEAAKKLLLENNGGVLRTGGLLYVGALPLAEERREGWLRERLEHEAACWALDGPVREMYWDQPRALPRVAAFVADARMWGWQLGDKGVLLEDLLLAAVDTPVAVATNSLETLRDAGRRLYADALRVLGPDAFAVGSSPNAAKRLNEFVAKHPAYAQMRAAIQRLPLFMRQQLGELQVEVGREGAWFRRQFAVPLRGGAAYTRHVATILRRNLMRLGGVGLAISWVTPAVLALPDLYRATQWHERGRIAISTGVGVVAGAAVNTALLSLGVHSLAVMMLGPAGGFVVAVLVIGAVSVAVGKRVERLVESAYDRAAARLTPRLPPGVPMPPLVITPSFRGVLR